MIERWGMAEMSEDFTIYDAAIIPFATESQFAGADHMGQRPFTSSAQTLWDTSS